MISSAKLALPKTVLLNFTAIAAVMLALCVPDVPAQGDHLSDQINLIHQGDLVDVDVVGSTEFDWRGTLDPDGFLAAFRFADNGIFARCRSTQEVASSVREAYSRFLNSPNVRVTILDRSGRPTAVVYGAVRTPQRFRILRKVDLRELIVLAGGFEATASGEIEILRQSFATCAPGDDVFTQSAERVGGSLRFTTSIAALIAGSQKANPEILFGDVVTVNESPPVYVTGGVGTPSRIPFRAGLSLSRAVASAGGVAKKGDASKVTIFRRGRGNSEVIKADLAKIESGAGPDIELAAYDIVDVAREGGSERKFAPFPEDEIRTLTPDNLPVRVID